MNNEAKKRTDLIVKALLDKKAQDVVRIEVSEKTVVADYFIICSGRSSTQVHALCDHVEEELEKQNIFVLRKEGVTEGRWAVLDYGDVIVHLFNDESRLFYHLERLWGEGEHIEDI